MKLMKDWKPEEECDDQNCPYHGSLSVRGRAFTGRVTADRMAKTVSVDWERRKFWPKYDRYAKRKSRVKAHNPPCIDAKTGQKVRIAETRRLSKTKNFVVVQVLEDEEEIVQTVPEAEKKMREKEGKKADTLSEAEKAAQAQQDIEEPEDTEEETTEEEKEVPARSTVKSMTKDEIKEYADEEWGVELSTNDLKKEMIDQLFEAIEK